ncbi:MULTISPECIES: HigA family addiction module antitoxin [unclassified Methylobacterium]|uniref:HigA family addiction module antitoxin n=1 Tax=unclassified Methylobacterium TaxID=2615210 RepID=UPI001FBAA769|nr:MULTISPECIES: HigA family addiction module antitoxin [unclassified Methylobacterium]MCJ2092783.1 HigA family addiction module antitoxin [Methylobacterium sp. J-072]MCJ2138506.1 HigA family addiction module antitoxin [Methylobacterium sp. E-066]
MNTVYRLENPGHPGGFLRRKVFEPRNLTVMSMASLLGVTRQSLSDFLNEKINLNAEMAFRIEKVFGFNMEMMMDMQSRFEIAKVRNRERRLQSELLAKAAQTTKAGGQMTRTSSLTANRERAVG